MPRHSDAKEHLTDAALDLIWQSSYGATSVDDICDRAGVKKGSFYHFFKSKSDLAAAALDGDWLKRKPQLDGMFSPTVHPLERLRSYIGYAQAWLVEMEVKCGKVLGCPLCTLGSEVSTQDQVLRDKVQELMERKLRYFESAIRDAHALGLIVAPDAKSKARAFLVLFQGTLAQARIENSIRPVSELYEATLALLGAEAVAAPAA